MAITSVGSKITVKVPSIAAYYMKQIYWQQSVVVKLKAYLNNFSSIPTLFNQYWNDIGWFSKMCDNKNYISVDNLANLKH